ncbi:MAG: ATP-dependent RNA helicase RhlE [Parasphingorhabdus sp.]|jgi:ATP-dependent RNA helicase RhlE
MRPSFTPLLLLITIYMNFDSLGLSTPILRAVSDKGYTSTTPIQAEAIPAVLKGLDVMAAAQTGTGKTAAFTIPILEMQSSSAKPLAKQVRTLVLTPTRELAAQVAASVADYGAYLQMTSAVVFGGVGIHPQIMQLRRGVDILVATPGRLMDLYQRDAVKFDHLEVLVLDEADRMLDMGFIHDIKKIIALLPRKRQNLMFSATFSEDIRRLAKGLVNDPVEISVSPRNTTASGVKQWICPVDKKSKTQLLIQLTKDNNWHQVLVFCRTKHGANRLSVQLEKSGIKSAAIHGNKSQSARTKALADFKSGKLQTLVATDIAARGLDIDQLPQVVNFDLPNVPEDYVHRIGRTGRAGSTGQAVSLVSADEAKQLADIEKLIKTKLDRQLIDGFVPDHNVPETAQPARKARRPQPSGNRNNNAKPASKSRRPSGRGNGGETSEQNGNRSSKGRRFA